jgi:hypothetical protein
VKTVAAVGGATNASIKVSWPTPWDRDDQSLTYRVYRDGATTPVYTTTAASTFWQVSTLSFTDTGLTAGTHTYLVTVTDPDGNSVSFPQVSDTIGGGTPAPPPPGSDLALNKVATDSSNYGISTAAHAVDGNTDGAWLHNSVVLTLADQNAWWQVDLGTTTPIGEVDVYNRTDGSYAVMSDYWVFVSTTKFNTALTPAQQVMAAGVVYAKHLTSPPAPEAALTALGITSGRYVMIQQSVKQSVQLAEVVVT